MLTPTKLYLKNYCQHTQLTVDLSANLHILIGANGRGKSNILNAINFALTGLATPGAKSLDDDILDKADTATVSLDFELKTGEKGNITRTIKRKAGTNTVLKIGAAEPIEGAEKCQKTLQELLGNDLKTIVSTAIVGQHDISALLFSGEPSKRLAKLQTLLLGDIFTSAGDAIAEEKGRLYIDENVQATVKSDTKTLSEQEKLLKKLNSELATIERTLDSKKLAAVREKKQRVARYQELKSAWESVSFSLHQNAERVVLLKSALISVGQPEEISVISERVGKLQLLEQAWKAYGDYSNKLTQTITQQTQLQQQEAQLTQFCAKIPELKTRLAELQAAQEYYDTVNKVQQKSISLAEMQMELTQLRKDLEGLSNEQQGLYAQSRETSGRADILNVFLRADHHDSCPICGSALTENKVAELKELAQALVAGGLAVSEKLKSNEANTRQITMRMATLEVSTKQATSDLKTFTEKLSSLQAPKDEKEGLSNLRDSVQRELSELASKPEELASIKGALSSLTSQYETLLHSPAPKPDEAFSAEDLNKAREALKTAKAATEQRTQLKNELSAIEGSAKILLEQKAGYEQQAKAESLPRLDSETPFVLSDDEITYLSGAETMEADKVTKTNEITAAQTYINVLKERITTAENAVAGVVSTKDYATYLTKMGKVIKTLPNVILQHQLAELCKSMQEIIATFHFFQPFGVMVNDKLEFQMKYPNQVVRPIKKASGGEEIILGIAFRLAAHRKFSTLDWLAIDEPTNHLTDTNIKVLQQLIEHLKGNMGLYGIRKLIIATHSSILANSDAHIINI